jgi:hypothetical protein
MTLIRLPSESGRGGRMSEPARDPFYDIKPEKVWLYLTNICDKGKFKVVLEVNGQEKVLFESYVEQGEVIISEHHNLTWLLKKYD